MSDKTGILTSKNKIRSLYQYSPTGLFGNFLFTKVNKVNGDNKSIT